MKLDGLLRGAIDRVANGAVKVILPEGNDLNPRICRTLWRGPALPPFCLPLDRIGLPFAETAALRMEQVEPLAASTFFQRAAASGAVPYAVIGDSHSAQMVRRSQTDGRWLLPFHWLLRGASARGLGNEEGRSGSPVAVRRALAALETQNVPVIFKFGQVDVEFVYAFKRIESGRTAFEESHYAAFVDETADRYVAGLDALVQKTIRRRAVLASIFPPALSDRAWARGYMNAAIADQHADQSLDDVSRAVRALEIPSLATRTKMHGRFNDKLKVAAGDLGMTYLDCFEPFLGPDGLLATRYRGDRRGADHHLGFQAARGPIIAGLWSVLGGLGHV